MTDPYQRIVDDFIRQGGVGICAAVCVGSHTVAVRTAGVADRVQGIPVGPQHLFRIGSCTKTFVAAVLAHLAERGLVDLDAPAAVFFPDLPGGERITVRHLVNHRGGLPEFEFDIPMDPGRRWTPMQLVDFAFSVRTPTEPGRQAVYSNTGYVLAGQVIEQVTGASLAHNIRRLILEPLSLFDTWCAATEAFPGDRLARGYYYRPPPDPNATSIATGGEMWRTEGLLTHSEELQDSTTLFGADGAYAAGDMVGSAADLVGFLRGLFDLRVIGEARLAQMLADRWPVTFPGTRMEATGAGLFASRYAGRLAFGHQGGMPGFVTLMQHDPQARVTVAITTNAGSGNRLHFHATGVHAVMDSLLAVRNR